MKKAILNKYALNGYTVHSNLPIGAPMPWLSDNLPVGFLNCDHTKIKKSDYPELWDRLKNVPMCQSEETEYFFTPDLREVSLVGIGENGTLDISAHDIYDVGQFKDDQLQGHWHEFNSYRAQRGASSPYECFDDYTNPPSIVTRDNKVQNAITDGTNGTPRTGTTTHGKQVGVRWIIKATQYATVEQNAIDDTRFTTGNVLSAQKTKELTEENYSTEERIIGKWIDGKPIYRKVYNGTFSSGTSITVDDNIFIKYGIDKIIDIYSMANGSDPIQKDYFINVDDKLRTLVNGYSKNILLERGANFPRLPFDYHTILEYTKTTD